MSEFTQENIDEFRQYRNKMPAWIKGHSRYDKIPTKLFEDAIDEITSLRSELERVKAENEWHKYPDEKPEETEPYKKIIAIDLGGDFVSCVFYRGNFYANGQIVGDVKAWYLLPNYKTIYLPAAPEEGE